MHSKQCSDGTASAAANAEVAAPRVRAQEDPNNAHAKAPVGEWPRPAEIPGMEESNLIVRVDIDPAIIAAVELGAAGVARLMAKSGGEILATMGQEGWVVKTVDEAKGIFELSLPSVRQEFAGCVISIPAPIFRATVRDTSAKEGGYTERLQGDLILQNGKDILKVELGFPFRTTLEVSAAAWTRAKVGSNNGDVQVSSYVEIGLNVPKVPGISNLLQYFVKSYGKDSTVQCAEALAR
mmetsp:Transcript_101925/g.328796  ORF Transcript_101925/g.328796 Transcript_101925/m.328796 type:complete len:238 (+) Transcript_101925:58-771(+)